MVDDYLGAPRELEEFKNGLPADEVTHKITDRHSSNVRWDRELRNNLKRKKSVFYRPENITATQYRPFVKQNCYVNMCS